MNNFEITMRSMRKAFRNANGEGVKFKWRMSKPIWEDFWEEINEARLRAGGTERPLPPDDHTITFEGWVIEIVENGWIGIEIVPV